MSPTMNLARLTRVSLVFLCGSAACSSQQEATPSSKEPSQSASVAQAAAPPWTATWGASPQNSGTTFNGQTLRQIVHTSIGGSALRIRLSNAFGSQAVVFRDVHVAQRSSGSSIVAGTDKALTFGGQTSITVAPGASTLSDAIAFPVSALSDIAVSVYLPQPTGAATAHQQGTQTNYVAAGDLSGNTILANALTIGSYYFLASVDVQNTASLGAVVTLGASITDGVGSSQDSNKRWPNDLAVRLANAGKIVGVSNQGISGNNLLSDGAGQSALNRFDRDVLGQAGVAWVIMSDDPINDLGSSNRPTGAQLIAGLEQLVSRAHQAGIKFLCSTLTPFEGAGYWTPAGETGRGEVNAFIRSANSGCDAVVDQDTATHDPAHPTKYLPAYDSGDHLHPNEAGLKAIAGAVDLSLFGAGAVPPKASSVISLRAHANGQYVTAENAGAAALIANRTAIGTWEQFDELDQGNGLVALRAHANGKYVSADAAGASPLIANRDAVGVWETFQRVDNPDGSVTLRAQANGKYVTAENGGSAALIANRTAIGPWEELDRLLQ